MMLSLARESKGTILFLCIVLSAGGTKGFDKVVWDMVEYKNGEIPSITFKYHSKDGEEGKDTQPDTN